MHFDVDFDGHVDFRNGHNHNPVAIPVVKFIPAQHKPESETVNSFQSVIISQNLMRHSTPRTAQPAEQIARSGQECVKSLVSCANGRHACLHAFLDRRIQ